MEVTNIPRTSVLAPIELERTCVEDAVGSKTADSVGNTGAGEVAVDRSGIDTGGTLEVVTIATVETLEVVAIVTGSVVVVLLRGVGVSLLGTSTREPSSFT